MNYKQQGAIDIARKALSEGLRVFLADAGYRNYGCFTDDTGKRVVSFEAELITTFSGNYKSKKDGTGWRICDSIPTSLTSLLNAYPFQGITFDRFTTIEEHLKMYGASSKYHEVREQDLLEMESSMENKP